MKLRGLLGGQRNNPLGLEGDRIWNPSRNAKRALLSEKEARAQIMEEEAALFRRMGEEKRAQIMEEEAALLRKQAREEIKQQGAFGGIRPAESSAQAQEAQAAPMTPESAQQEEERVSQTKDAVKPSNLPAAVSSVVSQLETIANNRLGCVDFIHPQERVVVFRRFSDRIEAGERMPSDEVMLAMLEMGRAQFGAIEVYGTPEFIANAVRVAIKHGIVLHNKEYYAALEAQSDTDKETYRSHFRPR